MPQQPKSYLKSNFDPYAYERERRFRSVIIFISILCFQFLYSCRKHTTFEQISPSHSHIYFKNELHDTDSLNELDYLYFYNGAGVAVGDINNDGLQDIFFVANRKGGNKLYLNKGNFQFEDITEKAGVKGDADWSTGVTMADVNGDGLLDIYVSTVSGKFNLQGHNQLFINNGDLTFTEKSKEYGLDFSDYSTQAVFFDYDKDGDLDCYLLNQSDHEVDVIRDTSVRRTVSPKAGDRLLRNDNGKFVDVSAQSGIYSSGLGYGLGIAIGDLNNDGWDDIYVGNDFHENDYYYINNHDGTFTESGAGSFGHYSRFSMGNDIADYNNDGLLDLITMDMLPPDESVLKTYMGDDALDIYKYKLINKGFQYQYSRNALQRNNDGKHFSDIALYSGIAATDWSWSPLFADFDNDGIKDLFISNGILRRPTDMDYLKFIYNSNVQKKLTESKRDDSKTLELMPEGKSHNYFFKGTPEEKFLDLSEAWGFTEPTLSSGAAYADLDNDGNLDLVVNHMNEEAGIFRNNSTGRNFLDIKLKGSDKNRFGIGTKVYLFSKGKMQLVQQELTRGFQSSVSPVIHFGLDTASNADSLIVVWPNLKSQNLLHVAANQVLELKQESAIDSFDIQRIFPPVKPIFTDVTHDVLQWRHSENIFYDFGVDPFIPHEESTLGPKIAVGDVNGDGLEDFFICGSQKRAAVLFVQTPDGKFIRTNQSLFQADSSYEAVNAIFFDADGDKDLDLYVVSGGNEYAGNSPWLNDRLYINDGKGNFSRSLGLPPMFENKSCVTVADVDGDGDLDLFVGSRVVADAYGNIPNSFLLINDGKGHFHDAIDQLAPGLKQIGMVSSAQFADINKDGKPDLVVAGEWMPITVFINDGKQLKKQETDCNTSMINCANGSGWWQSLDVTDLNGDGFPDIIAGNYGLNSKLSPSAGFPLKLYLFDYDNNGKTDQIMAYERGGKYYTFLGKDELEKQMPLIKKDYLQYKGFAGKTIDEIFKDKLTGAKLLEAANFASAIFINDGKGHFQMKELPFLAQLSPIFALQSADFLDDGSKSILCAGNFYGVLPYEGRYDASYGNLIQQSKDGRFTLIPSLQSGLNLSGEVRDIKIVKTRFAKPYIIIARNNDSLTILK